MLGNSPLLELEAEKEKLMQGSSKEEKKALGQKFYLLGIESDLAQAEKCYQSAIALGDDLSKLQLGSIWYASDDSRKKEQGIKLLEEAAEAGIALAYFNLSVVYADQEEWEKSFDACYKAMERGEPRAYYDLTVKYQNGEGVEKDENKARVYLALYRDKSETEETTLDDVVTLGEAYYFGEVIDRNLDEAFRYFKIAYEAGREECSPYLTIIAYYDLAAKYQNGDGVEKDENKARFYLALYRVKSETEETTLNDIVALGDAYFHGEVVNCNLDEAFRYYQAACEAGRKECYLNLANIYLKRIEEVLKWFEVKKKLAREEDLKCDEHARAALIFCFDAVTCLRNYAEHVEKAGVETVQTYWNCFEELFKQVKKSFLTEAEAKILDQLIFQSVASLKRIDKVFSSDEQVTLEVLKKVVHHCFCKFSLDLIWT